VIPYGFSLRAKSVLFVLVAAAGCASAPRGPVGRLSDAGIAATSTFGSEVRATASALDSVPLGEVFARTFESCSNPRLACPPESSTDANDEKRKLLAAAVLKRAEAIDALSGAYRALKADADYDARGDMAAAADKAITGVNDFAAAVSVAGGAAPGAALIAQPLARIAGAIAGGIADRKQRRRLLAGSAAIRPVTQRLRDALAVEAFVFAGLSTYLVTNRTELQRDLLDAGLVGRVGLLADIARGVDMVPVPTAEAVITGSPAVRAALSSVLDAKALQTIAMQKRRYLASLAALDGLVAAHDELAAGSPLTLVDIDRLLNELTDALPAKEK